MVHILLLILKIIGIILLIIAGLLLLAVITVLFVPVRYRILADYHGHFKGKLHIGWLFNLLRINMSYDKESDIRVKALFFTLYDSNKQQDSQAGNKPPKVEKKPKHKKEKNVFDEEKKENFAQNGASLMGENYEYKRYGTVKVLHTKDNSIEEMKMDEYLLGVVSAEMPADFEEEALKAQAVVARTYTVYKIEHNQSKHGEADICDNSACCQAWISKDDRMARWDEDKRESNWEKIEKAVSSTAGKVVTYNGEVIDAFFHSNSGGKTEEVSNVWGGSDLPYLQSVETAGEDAYSQYQSEAIFTKEEFEKKIKEKYQEFTIDYKDENCIKVIEYTQGDRVKTIKIGNLELSGVEVRSLLALRSANFTTQISENEIKFTVKGYGHGVGMSQTGADSMAKQGSNYEEIIKHYYTGVEITNL